MPAQDFVELTAYWGKQVSVVSVLLLLSPQVSITYYLLR